MLQLCIMPNSPANKFDGHNAFTAQHGCSPENKEHIETKIVCRRPKDQGNSPKVRFRRRRPTFVCKSQSRSRNRTSVRKKNQFDKENGH